MFYLSRIIFQNISINWRENLLTKSFLVDSMNMKKIKCNIFLRWQMRLLWNRKQLDDKNICFKHILIDMTGGIESNQKFPWQFQQSF